MAWTDMKLVSIQYPFSINPSHIFSLAFFQWRMHFLAFHAKKNGSLQMAWLDVTAKDAAVANSIHPFII